MTIFNLIRINPNQTQVFFEDGRFETLTDVELDSLMSEISIRDRDEQSESSLIN